MSSWLSISSYIPKRKSAAAFASTTGAAAACPEDATEIATAGPATELPPVDPQGNTSESKAEVAVTTPAEVSEDAPPTPPTPSDAVSMDAPADQGETEPATTTPVKKYSRGLSTSIYSWFSSDRKRTPVPDHSFTPPVVDTPPPPPPEPSETSPESRKRRQSSFWFSYSSPSPAETMANLGAAADLNGSKHSGTSLMWIPGPGAADEMGGSEGAALRSLESSASLEEVISGGKPLDKGKFFSLVECDELPGEGSPITCCKCGLSVSEYIVMADDGSKWHAKCFASAMCPEEDDVTPKVEHDNDSDPFGSDSEENSVNNDMITDSDIPQGLQYQAEESFSDFSETGVEPPTDGRVMDMTEAISWAVSADVTRLMEAACETTNLFPGPSEGSFMNENSGATLRGDDDIDNSGRSPVAGADQSMSGRDMRAAVLYDEGEKLDTLLVELHALGLFEHNYCTTDGDMHRRALDIEKEADDWASKVGNTIDRTIGIFPPALFRSEDKFTGGTPGRPVTCVSHAATVMHCIRLKFGLTMQEYAASFSAGEVEGGDVGEGKSGKRIWYTADRRFVVKVLGNQEYAFLNRILPSYYNHMISNGSHTLICRFMGLYSITIGSGYPTRIVVMNNVFYHPPNPMAPAAFVVMDELYDLKGSAINRCVTQEDSQAGVTVMKDLNFCENHNGTDTKGRPIYASDGPGRCRKLPLDAAFSAMLKADIENDCTWLAEEGIMDYSLLVGKGHLEFNSELGPASSFEQTSSPLVAKEERPISKKRTSSRLEYKRPLSIKLPHPLCRDDSLHSSFQNVAQTVPWRSVWQEHWGGVSCVYTELNLPRSRSIASSPARRKISVGEPAILYVGVVDILQEYNLLKRIETAYKMKLLATLGHDPNLISAIDAHSYAERFTAFIESHL